VAIEATGNAAVVAEVLTPYVDRVVIANPRLVHMIAHANVKTDTPGSGPVTGAAGTTTKG